MFRNIILSLILLVSCAVIYVAMSAYLFLTIAPSIHSNKTIVFRIERGESFKKIAENLENNTIIKNALQFQLLARLTKYSSKIKAGEYALNQTMLPFEVLKMLASGKSILYKIKVPEGLAWWHVAQIVAGSNLTSYNKFEQAIHDRVFLKSLNITFPTAEGYLYPETYMETRQKNADPKPLIKEMVGLFWKNINQLNLGNKTNKEINDLVILASLVEKETADESERFRIAGVYANRIRLGMLLQCDPTIIYGIGPSFEGRIRRADIDDSSNLYNTYQHKGLPPSPICSPSLKSLEAALNPEKNDYLYFVSQNNGTHYFSKSLEEHNRAVNKFQRN